MAPWVPPHLRLSGTNGSAASINGSHEHPFEAPIQQTPANAQRSVSADTANSGGGLRSSRWVNTARTSNMPLRIIKHSPTPTPTCNSPTSGFSTDTSFQRTTPGLTTGVNTNQSPSNKHPGHSPASDTESSHTVTTKSRHDHQTKEDSLQPTIRKADGLSKPRQKKLPGGWLTKEERKAMRVSQSTNELCDSNKTNNENGGWGAEYEFDWNAPNQLVDWEGKILPAPVEWADRRKCQRDNWADFIIKYIQDSQLYYVDKKGHPRSTLIIDISDEGYGGEDEGEVAPTDWIIDNIESQTLQSFWKSLLQIMPKPMHDEDLQGDPFWLRYRHGSCFLQPLEHNDARCEPVSDEAEDRTKYLLWNQKNGTADTSIITHLRKMRGEEDGQWKSRRKGKASQRRASQVPKVAQPPNPNHPTVNICLRPMNVDTDIIDVLNIYEHWANKTVYVSEMKAPDLDTMVKRLQAVQEASLPLIVAVESSRKGDKHVQEAAEKLLGFAYADEYEGKGTQMSFTAGIEMYIHKDYQSKGIGKTLLDRILFLLDPVHQVASDVMWKLPKDQPDFVTPGGRRFVSSIRIVLYYGTNERERCVWIREWLERYGFEMEADFSKAGVKLGQWTRQAVFQKETGCAIDALTVVRLDT